MRPRLVVRFAIDGDLRFLSHRDTMRLFERALARAQWPVKFTEGFNPRPRLSLPLPRSVGMASDDELLVVELTQPTEPDEALRDLARHMPPGIRLLDARSPAAHAGPQPQLVWYEVPLTTETAGLDETVAGFLSRGTCPVRRAAKEDQTAREVDIRPYVETIARNGDRLAIVLRVTPQGSARPSEVLDAIGLPGRELAHRVRRTRVEWTESIPPHQSATAKERTLWNQVTNPAHNETGPADASDGTNPASSLPAKPPSENPNS